MWSVYTYYIFSEGCFSPDIYHADKGRFRKKKSMNIYNYISAELDHGPQ